MTLHISKRDSLVTTGYVAPTGDRVSSISTRRLARVLQDGLRFGKYQIVRLIAIGGMSEVYEAVHVGLKKRVALKVMRPDLAESAEARQRFVSEGVNAARIRHTNVVDVTDVGVVDELPYLVMALLEGEDLGMVYDRQGRLATHAIVDLLLPVASAVSVGHAKGVVHRDLKPDNIFLHREGCRVIPKVLDFGVSRVMSARRITLNASVFGTPHYMSPEQARGAATDARTDQYSLGVILYEGVTGRLPRDSTNPLELLHAVAYDSFQRPSEYVELPDDLEAVILRAMASEPDDRFGSMRDLALALVPFANEASREYWSLELGPSQAETDADSATPLVARHPSRPPEAVSLTVSRASYSDLAPLAAHAETQPATHATHATNTPGGLAPLSRIIPAPRESRSLPAERADALIMAGRATGTKRRVVAVSAALLLLAAAGGWLVRRSGEGSESALAPVAGGGALYDVEVRTSPGRARLTLDGSPVGEGYYRGQFQRDGRIHELQAHADGFAPRSVRFQDGAPPEKLELTALPPATLPAPPTRTTTTAPPLPPPAATTPATRAARARWAARARAAAAEQLPTDALPAPEIAAQSASSSEPALPRVAVIERTTPRIQIVDDAEPRVQLIE